MRFTSLLRRATRKTRWRFAYWRLRHPKTAREPILDEAVIFDELRASPFPVAETPIDVEDWRRWRERAQYDERHPDYYRHNLAEKSLEHYFAARLLDLRPDERYIDVGGESATTAEIYHRLYGARAYSQDLSYPPGVCMTAEGGRIGGDAARMPVPDDWADAMALHCAFEHFEGNCDSGFIREAGRVLRAGGRCVIAPLYLAQRYFYLTDPLRSAPEDVEFEDDALLVAMKTWPNRHGRFYDVERLVERVWRHRGPLEMTIHVIPNFRDVDPSCYLRYALHMRKR